MATSCIIGKKEKDGKVKCICCHFDGYLDSVGRLLNDYYRKSERVDQLLELGVLETLGKSLEVAQDGKSNEYCRFYCRDKGEDYESVRARDVVFDNLPLYAMHMGANYVYLYDDVQWLYAKVEVWEEFDEPEVDLCFNSLSNWCWHDDYQKFSNANNTVSLYDVLTTFAM